MNETIDRFEGRVEIDDVRRGMGRLLEDARGEAWKAIREQGEDASIPVSRFARLAEGLSDLDRALAAIEKSSTAAPPH